MQKYTSPQRRATEHEKRKLHFSLEGGNQPEPVDQQQETPDATKEEGKTLAETMQDITKNIPDVIDGKGVAELFNDMKEGAESFTENAKKTGERAKSILKKLMSYADDIVEGAQHAADVTNNTISETERSLIKAIDNLNTVESIQQFMEDMGLVKKGQGQEKGEGQGLGVEDTQDASNRGSTTRVEKKDAMEPNAKDTQETDATSTTIEASMKGVPLEELQAKQKVAEASTEDDEQGNAEHADTGDETDETNEAEQQAVDADFTDLSDMIGRRIAMEQANMQEAEQSLEGMSVFSFRWMSGEGNTLKETIALHKGNTEVFTELQNKLQSSADAPLDKKKVILETIRTKYNQATKQQMEGLKDIGESLEKVDQIYEVTERIVKGADFAAEKIAGVVVPKGDVVYKVTGLTTKFLTSQIATAEQYAFDMTAELAGLLVPKQAGKAVLNTVAGRKMTAGLINIVRGINVRSLRGADIAKTVQKITTFVVKEGVGLVKEAYEEYAGLTKKDKLHIPNRENIS